MREVLGKKLSKGTKKDLDDISTKTGITLKSCRRQVGTAVPSPHQHSISCIVHPFTPPHWPLPTSVVAAALYPASSPWCAPSKPSSTRQPG